MCYLELIMTFGVTGANKGNGDWIEMFLESREELIARLASLDDLNVFG